MTKEMEMDFFGDGMRVFLDYINRQFIKNSEYRPHPIVRAFECAFHNIDKLKLNERAMGVSQEGTKDCVYEPYLVVLEKRKDGIKVLEIQNMKLKKSLPLDIMIILFRLQIQLDRITNEEFVYSQEAVNALNEVIPGENFYALGDQWLEARNEFVKQLELGKISLPNDPELIKGLKSIKKNTPWGEYPKNIRALIGSFITESIGANKSKVIITSPKDAKIEKFKIFDIANEFMIGRIADELKSFGDQEKH